MDLPMDQDDARVGRIASFDVVHVDARRDFGRIVLEAHDDEMSYCACQLYARAILGVWNGCCDHEYKLRPLTYLYIRLMDVGEGANVIKALKESAKRFEGGETRTAQRRMILYKMKVGCPCPSVSVLGPGLVMYQDFWAAGTDLVCGYRPWIAGRHRNFDMT
jgi:hypothetical protein